MPRNLFSLRRVGAIHFGIFNPCVLLLVLAVFPATLCSCGGGGSKPTPVSVNVGAKTATINVNATQTFSATVANASNAAITWSVQEGAAGGTITSTGVYTAPATPGTYHIIVTSRQDPTKTAVITVVVTPPVSLSLTPASVIVRQGAAQTFTATVQNAVNAGVTWSVQEGATGGSVTNAGVYTAPATAGTYHVIATSQQDTTKTFASTVTVPVNVSVLPATATLSVRQSLTFAATVTGSANQSAIWSVQEAGGGTITASGVYTAPSAAGTYHILAKSAFDPTQSAFAVITVQSSSASGTIQ